SSGTLIWRRSIWYFPFTRACLSAAANVWSSLVSGASLAADFLDQPGKIASASKAQVASPSRDSLHRTHFPLMIYLLVKDRRATLVSPIKDESADIVSKKS